MRRSKAFTLVEVLIYGIILVVAGSAVIGLMISLRKTQVQITGGPTAHAHAQDAVAAVAAFVRRAPLCLTTAGCSGVINSAFKSASSDSLSVYTSSAGTTATFTNENGALNRAQGTSKVAIIPNSLTIKFEYLLSPEYTYTMAASTDSLKWLNEVPAESLQSVVAVRITATISRDDLSSVQSSIVRLRNSPKKVFGTS